MQTKRRKGKTKVERGHFLKKVREKRGGQTKGGRREEQKRRRSEQKGRRRSKNVKSKMAKSKQCRVGKGKNGTNKNDKKSHEKRNFHKGNLFPKREIEEVEEALLRGTLECRKWSIFNSTNSALETEREKISMVPCVEEDRVQIVRRRIARSFSAKSFRLKSWMQKSTILSKSLAAASPIFQLTSEAGQCTLVCSLPAGSWLLPGAVILVGGLGFPFEKSSDVCC